MGVVNSCGRFFYSVWPKMSNMAPNYGDSRKHYPQHDSCSYVTKMDLVTSLFIECIQTLYPSILSKLHSVIIIIIHVYFRPQSIEH